MVINGSPDINVLDAQVTWDISGVNPVISLVNLSMGPGLSNVIWWILAASPSGTQIHDGSENQPDITGDWTDEILTDPWPRPFGQIEWSGAPYSLQLFAKDSAGNIYSITKTIELCRPTGNVSTSKNFYAKASTYVLVKCEEAGIFFQNQTNTSYKGQQGIFITSTLRVIFPIDPTLTIPAPFQISNFNTALVPISYSSENYQFVAQQVYEYDMGDYVLARIKYQQIERFSVLCNIDLCPLACEIAKLVNDVETGNCADASEANRKLGIINSKFALVVMGKLEPLCGIDIVKLIDEIQQIGDFDCDCCNANTGIIPVTSSVIGGYNFSINPVCGDIAGNVSTVGNNITFNLQDKKYVFAIYPGSPQETTAFSVVPNLTGCTKTYYLNIDVQQLAEDILNTIKSNAALVNLFNSIVQAGGGSSQLIVDGQCIFSSTSTCDYTFGLSSIPASVTFALLTGIKIGSNNISLNFSFNQTNLPALQTYLNSIGYGSFTVVNNGSGNITITSSANPNDIQSLTYRISSTNFIAVQTRDCTGYIPITANEAVQAIINYVCNLNDAQVVTSVDYVITYLDNTGAKQTVTVAAGSTLAELITELLAKQSETIDNIDGVAAVTCTSLKNIFATNNLAITANDFVFLTKGGGVCSKGNFLDLFNYMLQVGVSNATTKNLFCQFVTQCAQGLTCAPYNYFNVFVTTFDAACTQIVGIEYTLN